MPLSLEKEYKVIGVMSGSSLDGLDLAYCTFKFGPDGCEYKILHADCIPLADGWFSRLKNISDASGKELMQTNADLGRYFAEKINEFIIRYKLFGKVDLISTHGHTVYHFPELDFTTQIGDGAHIAAITGIKTASNFRSMDIAYGGQGTPIVPIGDMMLFGQYKYCLNIGGIANISVKLNGKIIAYDICVANQVLNFYAAQAKKPYDENGDMARSGMVHSSLFDQLQDLPFYEKNYPKSLDNSFTRKDLIPMINQYDISLEDKLRTFTEHIAFQIAHEIKRFPIKHENESMLITGGGAFNRFLVECIQTHSEIKIDLPDPQIIEYKEALIIALMGVLRQEEQENVLQSVTGAQKDNIGGVIHLP